MKDEISGGTISACFSQNKEELIIEVSKIDGSPFFIRALLLPSNTSISFPKDFKRSKKNNIDLFPEIIGKKITNIKLLNFERAFYLALGESQALLFKMHGSRSNLLYFKDLEATPFSIFRKELKEDLMLTVPELEKSLELTKARFLELEGNASQFLPTLGKRPRAWLKEAGYLEGNIETRFALMGEVMDMLESPLFSVINENDNYYLTLLPCTTPIASTSDPLEASNIYFQKAVVKKNFENVKNQLLRTLSEKRKKTVNYISKTRQKLEAMENEPPPSQTADIIMANLHQIPVGTELVSLFDFYANETREIALKRGLSPQKFAEQLYKKSKNKKIEFEQLRKNLAQKEKDLEEIATEEEFLLDSEDFRSIKSLIKTGDRFSKVQPQLQLPYKRFETDGFEIWVGKSAKANDELLRRYTWKEDLWLHAKDVSGSHVIIKTQSGMVPTKLVLERAAALAAHYSKNKTASLAAVMYTPCKYVRKVKGSLPGAVKVDREKVILVKPEGPEEI
ncbi:NFACT RNA binding domain-containing protein [uncultured Cyclobacterium sp.]|uniref:NFACT RNA binding domain-containing protein n=1 Tax=uncultured Cyclobacterium sp. TaxID=453820 RepID=UPI0030EBB4ED